MTDHKINKELQEKIIGKCNEIQEIYKSAKAENPNMTMLSIAIDEGYISFFALDKREEFKSTAAGGTFRKYFDSTIYN